jgi:exopolysaccharide biosynthesis polyprenyl glycosylphosphotransferase
MRWLSNVIAAQWLRYVLDSFGIALASVLAWYIRYQTSFFRKVEPGYYSNLSSYLPLFSFLLLSILTAFYFNRVYSVQRRTTLFEEMGRMVNGVVMGIMISVVVTFGMRPLAFSRLLFIYDAALILLFLGSIRIARRLLLGYLRSKGYNLRRVLIVGAGENGRAILRAFVAEPQLGFQVVGFLDDNPQVGHTDIGRFRALGTLLQLEGVLKSYQIDDVVIALPWRVQPKIKSIVQRCEYAGIRPWVIPDTLQLNLSRIEVNEIGGVPLLGIKESVFTRVSLFGKRVLDLLLITLSSVIWLPLFLMIYVLIWLRDGQPVIFKQTRIGLKGKPFKVWKFRTMVPNAEALQAQLMHKNEASGPLFKMKDDPRLTTLGKFLRKWSLDELPQAINILKGDMSIVGPRPGLPQEVAQYEPWQRQRLQAMPGLTGLWQVSGRSDLSFEEMCLLDIYYVENWSTALDLSVMVRTPFEVIRRKGAY